MPEYGNPDSEVDFKNIVKYSPLHNVPKSGHYPATLVTTCKTTIRSYKIIILITIFDLSLHSADHDDRVVPSHSLKFISELQHNLGEKLSSNTPLMIRVGKMSGHGGGISTTKQIEENVDLISFIMNSLKLQKFNQFEG